jgi:hypothetical protein
MRRIESEGSRSWRREATTVPPIAAPMMTKSKVSIGDLFIEGGDWACIFGNRGGRVCRGERFIEPAILATFNYLTIISSKLSRLYG